MKAERRHELQQNELADWLAAKYVGVRPYVTTIVAVIVAVAAVWIAYSWYRSSVDSAKMETWNQFYKAVESSTTNDDTPLRDFVRDYQDSPAGVIAQQRLAMLQMSIAANRQLSNRSGSLAAYQEAIDNFSEVIAKTDNEALKRFASFQIALARESRYELDAAIKAYEEIIEKWPGSMEAQEAALRVADLKNPATVAWYDWHRTVNPAAPPPVPTPPVEPSSDLDTLPDAPPTDATLPPTEATLPPAEADAAPPKATEPDDAPTTPTTPSDEPPGDKPLTEKTPAGDAPAESTPSEPESNDDPPPASPGPSPAGEPASDLPSADGESKDKPTAETGGLNPRADAP